jgi:septal ring factor EnvC (AmiA/AmiB activator)
MRFRKFRDFFSALKLVCADVHCDTVAAMPCQVAIRKMQGQHDRVVKEYEKRLSRMTSLEQEVTELKGKLEKATAALRSSKMSFSAVKHSVSALSCCVCMGVQGLMRHV